MLLLALAVRVTALSPLQAEQVKDLQVQVLLLKDVAVQCQIAYVFARWKGKQYGNERNEPRSDCKISSRRNAKKWH